MFVYTITSSSAGKSMVATQVSKSRDLVWEGEGSSSSSLDRQSQVVVSGGVLFPLEEERSCSLSSELVKGGPVAIMP